MGSVDSTAASLLGLVLPASLPFPPLHLISLYYHFFPPLLFSSFLSVPIQLSLLYFVWKSGLAISKIQTPLEKVGQSIQPRKGVHLLWPQESTYTLNTLEQAPRHSSYLPCGRGIPGEKSELFHRWGLDVFRQS